MSQSQHQQLLQQAMTAHVITTPLSHPMVRFQTIQPVPASTAIMAASGMVYGWDN